MTDSQNILIIYNPNAGQKRTKLFNAIIEHLKTPGISLHIEETQFPGHAKDIANHYKDGPYDKIVAAGGDGTINEVINGLYPSPLPLGIIPLGTANVLAKEIYANEKPENIAHVIKGNDLKKIWPGAYGNQLFSLMISAGADAQSVCDVNLALKKNIGKAAYAISFLKQFISYQATIYEAVIEGVSHQASSVIVTNSRYYGGKYLCAAEADISRKELHILLFQKKGRLATLTYALKMLLNKIPNDRSVKVIKGNDITLKADENASFQCDGDPGDILPISIKLSEHPISLLYQKET